MAMEGPVNTEAWLRLNAVAFAPHRLNALLEVTAETPLHCLTTGAKNGPSACLSSMKRVWRIWRMYAAVTSPAPLPPWKRAARI